MGVTSSSSRITAGWDPRGSWVLGLQMARLPAAVALLTLVREPAGNIARGMGFYTPPDRSYAPVWFQMVVAIFAFMVVIAVGRRRGAPLALLAVELVTAGTIGFVPPDLWDRWPTDFPTRTISVVFVAPLAIAWFTVCLAALMRQMGKGRQGEVRSLAAGLAIGRLSARARARIQWLRVPLLLSMLLLMASHRENLAFALSGARSVVAVWVPLTLTALAFSIVVVAGRRGVPWPLVAVELTLSGLLSFVPRPQWLTWSNASELGSTLSSGFTAPLAIAWFTVCLIAALDDRRTASAS